MGSAWAATIYVDDNAPNDPGPGDPTVSDPLENGTAEHPFDAIQQAIDAAVAGDTVLVADGTYRGAGNRDIVIPGRPLHLRSQYGYERCIIDCEGSEGVNHRGFFFSTAQSAVRILEGFCVRNGYAKFGGAISGESSATVPASIPEIRDCRFEYNTAAFDGGAISWFDAILINCVFVSNTAIFNGGALATGIYQITNCTFLTNQAKHGGAIAKVAGHINSCDISDNTATDDGGGVYLCGADITNCHIQNNTAGSGGGGYKCSGEITNCLIQGNSARKGGGLNRCSGKIARCQIENNQASMNGGGLYCCTGIVQDCTIQNNSADIGGGVSCQSGEIVDCTIRGNSAIQNGGGFGTNCGIIRRCRIELNTAGSRGGGIYESIGDVINCLVIQNSAPWGAGIHFPKAMVRNCTIVNNTASSSGGGICWGQYDGEVENCIVWGNSGGQIYSCPIVRYSCIEGGAFGKGVISTDPGFVNTEAGDYHLSDTSTCIDQAWETIPSSTMETDFDGNYRFLDGDNDGIPIADFGAYEYGSLDKSLLAPSPARTELIWRQNTAIPEAWKINLANIGVPGGIDWQIDTNDRFFVEPIAGTLADGSAELTVNFDPTGLGPGRYTFEFRVLSNASNSICPISVDLIVYAPGLLQVGPEFVTIQSAIDTAESGDTITVADGIYTGYENCDIDFKGKAITLRSAGGAERCIIDCRGTSNEWHRGFNFTHNETPASILDGFTISNGYYSGPGAIYILRASPTIVNCVLNRNVGSPGAVRVSELGSPLFLNCQFNENRSPDSKYYGGGAVSCTGEASPIFQRCSFRNNSALSYGGAIYNEALVTLESCEVAGNCAAKGGGIYNWGELFVNQCIILSNRADTGGGILQELQWDNGSVNNSIIAFNETLANGSEGKQIDVPADTFVFSYCDIFGSDSGLTTAHCLNLNPLFVDPGHWDDQGTPEDRTDDVWVEGDYHLQLDSPCIDAGDPAADFSLEPQPNGGRVNMGLYGNTPEATITVDTDEDGYSNPQENRWGLNPHSIDSDGDSLTDREEIGYDGDTESYDPYNPVTKTGTDMNAALSDTDGDGLSDVEEIQQYGSNPIDEDMDDDGLPDGAEIKTYETDPRNPDNDGDTLPDGWEVGNGLNPKDPTDVDQDLDRDGLSNTTEYVLGTAANRVDSDDDGMPDGWEVVHQFNPTDNSDGLLDRDEDGLPNSGEYANGCNPDEKDTDGDGMPDGWEVGGGLDPLRDDQLEDLDHDGLNNRDEYASGSQPNNPDSDGDRMSDGWEVQYGLNPTKNDSGLDLDRDGFTNLFEYLRGSAPNDKLILPQPGTMYVDDDAPGDPGPGDPAVSDPMENGTPEHPFDSIREVLDYSVDGDIIRIAGGTHSSLGFLVITKRVTLVRQEGADRCVLNFTGTNTGIIIGDVGGTGAVLEGLTLQSKPMFSSSTPGIDSNNSVLMIRNCVVLGSEQNMSPGIRVRGGAVSVIGTQVSGYRYSGVFCTDATLFLDRCVISDNLGDGIYVYGSGSTATINNCLVIRNGEAIGSSSIAEIQIRNCTIADNAAGVKISGKNAQVRNSILWNRGTELNSTGGVVAEYCDIKGGYTGTGNINAWPMFAGKGRGDYHLLDGSPCIQAGDPQTVVGQDEVDIDGDPRILYGRIDIGFDEVVQRDYSGDSLVDMEDLLVWTGHWMEPECSEPSWCGGADLTFDGKVGIEDLSVFAEGWLRDPTSPYGCWPLDGNWNERRGQWVGTAEGDPAFVDSMQSKTGAGAIELDGDDYIIVNGFDGILWSKARTCAAWIKTTGVVEPIVYWGNKDVTGGLWDMRVSSTGKLRVLVGGGPLVEGTTVVNTGEWTHVAAVVPETTSSWMPPFTPEIQLYVNGVQETVTATVGAINTQAGTAMRIGANEGGTNFFTGLIDDVRVYDRALTAEEIAELAGQ